MLVYKVQYKTITGDVKMALGKLNDKCGNCPKLETHAFNGLCGNNCTFNPEPVIKKLIEDETKEHIKILEFREIEEILYPHLYDHQWALIF